MKSFSRIAVVLAFGGGLILISWVTSPSALTPPRASDVPPAEVAQAEQATPALAPLTANIDDQAARLRARLAQPPPPPQPDRNPFTFRASSLPAAGRSNKLPTAGLANAGDPGPAPRPAVALALPALVATTADARDGGLMRTAVLSMNDEIAIVRPGQVFDRFIVELVGPDLVRLVDITSPTRATFSIAIR